MKSSSPHVLCSDEVAMSLAEGKPLVALESTLIAHGMPFPDNLEMAKKIEETIREVGAVPATMAVINGVMKAGLSEGELELLASGKDILKLSRRDLPMAMAQKKTGATTVASTMIIAAQAGIRLFATGGIGGVHRGAEHTWDVSADLTELATTPVAVVCAGAKAILDLPATLEFLETWGVPVVGYRTREFPAFYSRSSGLLLEARADSPQEIAAILHAKWNSGLHGGVVIAQAPDLEIPKEEIEPVIRQALDEAGKAGITGKALTPFLLRRVSEITGGRSLAANKALVLQNASLAALVAVAMSTGEI